MLQLSKMFLLSIVLIVISGCAGTFTQPEQEDSPVSEKPKPKKTRKYDPLGLKEDLTVVPASGQFYEIDDSLVISGAGQLSDSASPVAIGILSNSGATYRIQLFTSKEYGPSLEEMNVATEVFDRKVRLDYEVPYYKVRVGDFPTRSEAEAYLPAAQEAGYKTAWVVKAYQDIKTLEDIYEEETIPIIDSLEVYEFDSETAYDSLDYQKD
jgi:hypothetical protein